jgi:hypothetical protein
MLLDKSQLIRLRESWKNIIDPRKGFNQGVKIQKQKKLSEVEKRLANKYIEEGDESDESDDNKVDEFIEN